MNKLKRGQRRGGFTLVEVALALLVVAVGLTAMLALFPLGLQENQRAIEDARMAMFAEEVFNTMRGAIAAHGWQAGWAYLSSGANIPGVAPSMYKDSPSITVKSGFARNTYRFADGDYDSHSLQYQIQVTNLSFRRKGVVLTVIPGYAKDPTEENARVFFTEFFDFAMEP